MIKHVVCFRLKDKAKKEEAKALLLSMRGRVPAAKEIEAGDGFSRLRALVRRFFGCGTRGQGGVGGLSA